MANRPATIRQADIARTVKGVVAAGLSVSRVEVEGAKLVIYTNQTEDEPGSALDDWRRKNG
jgi:predicted metal-dependent RNase